MPVLSNARHERFAQLLAKGRSATEAYGEAGYNEDRGAASRLLAKVSVADRVAEIQQRAAEKTEITVEYLIERAERLMDKAESEGEYSPAVAALKELGVLSGKRIERSEHGEPGEFELLDDDEVEARILESAKELGVTQH